MDLWNELIKQPKILVIDDEVTNFEVIAALLHQDNYQLHYARNGQQGLAQIATLQPDMILLDVMMPGINGIEVCEQIKQNVLWQNIPILLITALSNNKDLAKCMSSGADDLISKPMTGLELRARVRSMVKVSQQHQTIQYLSQQVQANQTNHAWLMRRLQSAMRTRAIAMPSQLSCCP
jgi:two-component system, sensor histidine kinase and response regulator